MILRADELLYRERLAKWNEDGSETLLPMMFFTYLLLLKCHDVNKLLRQPIVLAQYKFN